MATHSSILAWRVPWTEPGWATVHEVAKTWTRLNAMRADPLIRTGRTLELK